MKKALIILAVLIAIIGIGATIFVGKVDGIIADAIRTEGTKAIGTKVSVTNVVTDFKAGSAIINGLSIANPPGYQPQPAFSVDQFKTTVDYSNQLIEEIIINKPTVNAELKGTKSNFEALIENMPKGSEPTQTNSDNNVTDDDIIITIKKLAITQTQVNLLSDKLGSQSFTINDLVMTNLSGTPEELAEQVTSKLTTFVSSEIQSFATNALKEKLQEKVTEQAKEKINDAIESKIGDKIKGLKFNLR